jgi:hypothetical protein
MAAALAPHDENGLPNEPPSPSRGEVLARYRHLRQIRDRHHSKVVAFLSGDKVETCRIVLPPDKKDCSSLRQCDIKVGTVIEPRIARVTPPRMNSRMREWP